MKNRSPIGVFFLGFIPFYSLYWLVSTAGEMRKLGADIPTALLLIVPFANIWWLFKFGQGAEHVTNSKTSAVLAFLVLWFLGSIGEAIVQDAFNNVSAAGTGTMGAQPMAAPMPMAAPAGDMTMAQPQMPATPSDPAAPQPPIPPQNPVGM